MALSVSNCLAKKIESYKFQCVVNIYIYLRRVTVHSCSSANLRSDTRRARESVVEIPMQPDCWQLPTCHRMFHASQTPDRDIIIMSLQNYVQGIHSTFMDMKAGTIDGPLVPSKQWSGRYPGCRLLPGVRVHRGCSSSARLCHFV